MKPIKFEIDHPDHKFPLVTCKNWLGREVKFYFDRNSTMWVNASTYKPVEKGTSLSLKLCAYSALQIHLIAQQRKEQ